MTTAVNNELRRCLIRDDGQEDLRFLLWYPSRGKTRLTALIARCLEPGESDRSVHGNASFHPDYVERAIRVALERGCGVAFVHSHPLGVGWQGMSDDDRHAEELLAPSTFGATGLPLVGLTLAGDGTWSGRFWERSGPRRYTRLSCETVRVVGERLGVSHNNRLRPAGGHRRTQVRTRTAWGEAAHAHFSRLRIGVVGLGSVGSIIAETLARMGIQSIDLLDFQSIELVNLDRTLNAYESDAEANAAKVDVAAKALRRSATAAGFEVEAHPLSVCEEAGYRAALDCDVLFSCVDRPWARSVLNFIAYAHLIPVIDGGIRVSRTRVGTLRGADWKAHVATFGHRCLLCLAQYDAGYVAADREGLLDDETYITSLPEEHPLRANENVFAFSLSTASLEVLHLVRLAVGPQALPSCPPQSYHLATGAIDLGEVTCDDRCVFPEMVAMGEAAGHPGIGGHEAAETAREARLVRPSVSLVGRVWNWIGRWLSVVVDDKKV